MLPSVAAVVIRATSEVDKDDRISQRTERRQIQTEPN
jgi:hypothetical protein